MKIRTMRYFFFSIIVLLTVSISAGAQKRLQIYNDYAKKFNPLAIKKMKEHGIPASITLAQGILESGAGQSRLAEKANNHFGIKCYDGWKGASITIDDDKRNECFKKYKSVEDSYEDHSVFLKRSRYQQLYSLRVTDYKGWARGLQQAGYATDKSYADKLIKIIEDYELYTYDSPTIHKDNAYSNSKDRASTAVRAVYKNNSVLCIIAEEGDSYETLARMFDKKQKDIVKFNDAYDGQPLKKGDVVYLQKKKKKAEKPYFDCVVKPGDTMHKISQKYAVQVDAIYKMNKFNVDHSLVVGNIIKLR